MTAAAIRKTLSSALAAKNSSSDADFHSASTAGQPPHKELPLLSPA
jgi:hypothetical protein